MNKVIKMKLSSYKLIISDLDGTLVPYYSDEVSPLLGKTVRYLEREGIKFSIATGRSWVQTKPIAEKLGITTPVIVQAGALVIDPVTEAVLRVKPLRTEIEMQLREILPDSGVDQFCLCESGVYYATKISTSGGDWLYNFGESCSLVKKWTHRSPEAIKHLFIGSETELRNLGHRITHQINPVPNLHFWPPDHHSPDWFLEVFDPSASKGQALQWLAERLGVGLSEAIAFGDSSNDLDMLRLAGTGVAIAGSSPEVLAVADFVTAIPEEDGIVKFLAAQAQNDAKVSCGYSGRSFNAL
jgi:Cof subfamily protein (haloacid dehalogenase superfamily)